MKRFLLLVASAFLLVFPTPAPACSLAPGYLMPSNFELVRDAEAIVLAKAVELFRDGNAGPPEQMIRFEVLHVLKGTVPQKAIALMGTDRWLGGTDPENFSEARRGAFAGMCIAYDYKLGSLFVVFLRHYNGDWVIGGSPFTRANEEVAGPDAPWSRAVAEYVRVAALATPELQKEALRELQKRSDKPIPGLAADIERHFHSPHGSKPFEDLKRLYDEAQTDDARADVLWAFAWGKHTAAVEIVSEVARSGELSRSAGPIESYLQRTHSASVGGSLARRLQAEKDDLPRDTRRKLVKVAAESADASATPTFLAMLKTQDRGELSALAEFFIRCPEPKATAEYVRRLGKDYEAHPALTRIVAALGDRGVLDWARGGPKTAEDQSWLPLHVIAVSPLPEADQAAQVILKGPDLTKLKDLMEGYGFSKSPNRIPRLLEGYGRRSDSPELARTIRTLLGRLAYDGDEEAAAALEKLPPSPTDKR